ncbi:bifunctional DNA primase/polymerase [Streptomyces sioyaensis]|uniref:DNA primase n=1 Tax=Streptomyces sioyaensis TaxID=67364 RepID=A0A4Q1QL63_9ACTN|nr:bifunctional DNA primase/polymerase [Streptomyces sioyaensis]MBM4794615.1 bifunctional DNA primase/polymerase [Streptomyces sioyaensis]RXS62266.1 DNA primase [Streptomyces sioyaensis]
MNTGLLTAALAAVERGWPVIPLQPGRKRPAGHPERSCPGTGRCVGGHRTPEQRATTDPALIHAAWATRPYNVGIATGPAGLLVLDLDPLKPEEPIGAPDGAASLQALCERADQTVPTTYRTRTARGGEHLYFTAPASVRLGNTAGKLGPHIDTRGWGGYVVAPGSTTPTGNYTVADDAPVAELPAWLTQLLRDAPQPTVAAVAPVRDGSRAARVALERECDVVRGASEGGPKGRNVTLHRSACKVARFVAWGHIPRHVVEEAIQAAGESTGLPPAECRTTIRSAIDWVLRAAGPRETA